MGRVSMAADSLYVYFPNLEDRCLPVTVAYDELACYGEIARLEVPPGMPSTAVVSYYDVRSATCAANGLGSRAEVAPQYSNRSVKLPGEVKLDAWMVPEVAEVRCETEGVFVLDFFDARAAGRAEKRLCSVPEKVEAPENLSAARGPLSGPRYCNDLRLSGVNWTDLANGNESRTTLRLRCLPAKLCDNMAFHKTLESAGLSKVLRYHRTFPPAAGKKTGSALVDAVDSKGVLEVAKYFHGRRWGQTLPVAVSFAATQGSGAFCTAPPGLEDLEARLKQVAAAEPWRVELCDTTSSSEMNAVSEVSTEPGDGADLCGGTQVPY